MQEQGKVKEYQVRIPVEVDEAHVAFRVATSAIALDVYAATPDLAVEIVTRAIEAVVANNEFGPPTAPPEACHPGAACSKPEPVDHATWDGSDSYRATIQSLRETNDRLRADLDASESLARSRIAEMDRLAAELEAERAKSSGPSLTKPMTAEWYDQGVRTSSVVLRSLCGSERIVVEYTPVLTGAPHDAVVDATRKRARFVLAPEHQDVTAMRERAEKAEAKVSELRAILEQIRFP
jgi:hypothetical protein